MTIYWQLLGCWNNLKLCVCSNLSKQQSAMQSGITSSGFCLLTQAVCNQSDSRAPLQNFWGGRKKTGDLRLWVPVYSELTCSWHEWLKLIPAVLVGDRWLLSLAFFWHKTFLVFKKISPHVYFYKQQHCRNPQVPCSTRIWPDWS